MIWVARSVSRAPWRVFMPKVMPEYNARQVTPTMTMPTTVSTSENALWWRFRAGPIESPAEVVFILFRPPAVASDIPRTGHPPVNRQVRLSLKAFAICDLRLFSSTTDFPERRSRNRGRRPMTTEATEATEAGPEDFRATDGTRIKHG